MITRSNDFARSRRPTHPAVKLALIVAAAFAVYACDHAASPTEPDSGTWGRILPIFDVTPGVTTVCQVGIEASLRVRVGTVAEPRTPQTVSVPDGQCAVVATLDPARQDDVIVSIDEAPALYYALDHIIFQHGDDEPRTMRGVDGVSFEGTHGAVVTFFNNAAVTVCQRGTNATFQYQVGRDDEFHALSLGDGLCSRIATIRPAQADDVIVTVRHDEAPTRRLDGLELSIGGLASRMLNGTNSVSFEGLHGAVLTAHSVRTP
jgi:hypothetical protein